MAMRGFALVNGNIYVSFKPILRVEAAVILGNRVAYVGSEAGALSRARALSINTIDLKGKTVLPGFIDAHIHLDSLGTFLNTLSLIGVRSIGEIKTRLRSYTENHRENWIIGRGGTRRCWRRSATQPGGMLTKLSARGLWF
ncbi:MAG: amidohydrolase family protein [Thermoproteota archaeon]